MTDQRHTAGRVEGLRSSAPSTPANPIPPAAVVLVWRDEAVAHRLRARSWGWDVIERMRRGPVILAGGGRTLCGIDLPVGDPVTIEVDGVPDCTGCEAGRGGGQPAWMKTREAVAA